jgi:hypothetical protein
MQCDGYSGAMELFSETLVAVDEHHAAPPWSELHIYGMAPNAEVLTLLAGYGATLIVPHDGFFTASREPSFSA